MSLVQIVPLGGAGEIGKNCTAVLNDTDMVVIDCGLSFPNEEQFGVDIVIPDLTFLKENREKLRGVFITHAHEDHVGALPYLLAELNVPIFASDLALAMFKSKLEERAGVRDLRLVPFNPGTKVEVGSLSVESIRITHSIPESTCIAVHTEHGHVLFTGDFKFDFTPVDGKLSDIARLTRLGDEGVVCLLSDSTNVERPGWGPSERAVSPGLRKAFAEAEGRVLVTTFASNIHRIQQVLDVAAELGRKVAVAGRRMDQTIDICSRMNYLNMPKNTKIRLDEIGEYPADKIVILTTGSQGEPMSALVQMSKQEYSRLQVKEGDTVVYSARPIPGNEAAIWRTVNRLFRMGAKVIYDSPIPVHVSGHAYQEELKMMINLTRPFYLAPVHGEPRHQHLYREMGVGMGYPDHRIFTMVDGLPLVIDEKSAYLGEPVPCGRILVDNGGNPGITDDVLRDRSNLANDGTLVVSVALDVDKGEAVGGVQVVARGYSGPDKVLTDAAGVAGDAVAALSRADLQDPDVVRHSIADAVRKYVGRRTQLRPVVVPVVIEI